MNAPPTMTLLLCSIAIVFGAGCKNPPERAGGRNSAISSASPATTKNNSVTLVKRRTARPTRRVVALDPRVIIDGTKGGVFLISYKPTRGTWTVLCTAFAAKKTVLVTTARCVGYLREVIEKKFDYAIVMNLYPSRRYRAIRTIQHPYLGKVRAGPRCGPNGCQPTSKTVLPSAPGAEPHAPDTRGAREPRVFIDRKGGSHRFSYDLGAIMVDREVPSLLPLASRTELDEIQVGDQIYYHGYPAEATSIKAPVASLIKGKVVRLTNAEGVDDSRCSNIKVVLHHDALTSTGTSGSPILSTAGKVIGVQAGAYVAALDPLEAEKKARAMERVSFGIKLDDLSRMIGK